MAKRSAIKKRRRQLCSLRYRGVPLSKIAEKLSDKFGVSESTIEHDWYTRKEWLEEVFDISLDDGELLMMDIISEEKEIKRECWKMFRDTSNENVKLGSIKQLRGVNSDMLEMLQSLGIVDRVAEKYELTGEDGGPITFSELAKKADDWNEQSQEE